ncbi:MAG: pFP-BETA [Parachlamydiales bacterium]|nr:pFP-BETA [Parachlamydiales bacterium]
MTISRLQTKRLAYQPLIPPALRDLSRVSLQHSGQRTALPEALCKIFPKTHPFSEWCLDKKSGQPGRPLKVGVLFSGGQAAGGHNVISGLYDGLIQIHPKNQLLGFLDGPAGLVENRYQVLTAAMIDQVRNLGGFDLIGSGRTKIETPEQFQAAARSASALQLDAIIIIGGDDSNTNAAHLAEYFLQNNIETRVIGAPKTIDGDLRSPDIEMSFGFDSAAKTYSELIGNIARDAMSAKKYYHFIKLMGRSASHLVLECALATCPNLAIIGEEKQTLAHIVANIAQLIEDRHAHGKDYGIVLLPEGLIEFIPEFKALIAALNLNLADEKDPQKVQKQLTEPHRSFFASLPEKIGQQLLLDRDPHGNVQLSKIETEVLLLDLVKKELKGRNIKIDAQPHFFGYEGRACFPTNFDANYCYSLGLLAALAVRDHATGVILAIKHLSRSPAEWEPKAVPIVQLMGFEMRSGKEKPVIAKTVVDLQSRAYRLFAQEQKIWRLGDCYQMPGPIQFYGDPELTDSVPLTL